MKRISARLNFVRETRRTVRSPGTTAPLTPTVAVALLAALTGLAACQRPDAAGVGGDAGLAAVERPSESIATIPPEYTGPIDDVTTDGLTPDDVATDDGTRSTTSAEPGPPLLPNDGVSPPNPGPDEPDGDTPVPPPAPPAPPDESAPVPETPLDETEPPVLDLPGPTVPPMTEAAIRAAVDPYNEASSVEIVAWGDVDGDGVDDAIVLAGWCGASCGTTLELVLATAAGPALYQGPDGEAFAPFYNGGGAAQSSLASAAIDDSAEAWDALGGSTILLTGTNLCNPNVQSEWNDCGPTERFYLFVGGYLEPIVGS